MGCSKKSAAAAILIFSIFCSLVNPAQVLANSDFESRIRDFGSRIFGLKKSIENKRCETRAKINELKRKEKMEISKLYQSQNKLEATKNDIKVYQGKLDIAQDKLSVLESDLDEAGRVQEKSARVAGDRLRQIFKGERVSMLHLIFASKDVNTFFDRIYYQKRLADYDRHLLTNLRAETRRLINVKQNVEYQKDDILSTINVMNEKKRQIASSITTSQYLINKLRTDRATYESAERELARQSQAIALMLEKNLKKSVSTVKISSGFTRPLMGMITSPYGWRRHPIFGSRSFHTGVDISSSYGTPIRASNSGKVIYTGWYGGYGKVVIVNHGVYKGVGTSTLYAHLSRTAASVGSSVKKGQTIGYEGTTGYSTGPHLHFEVRLEGKPTNPLRYI